MSNKKIKNFIFLIFGLLITLNILAWIAVFDLRGPQLLEVNFLDVGQGDSIFIETPLRNQILIDGGPSSIILEKLGRKMPFWDRSIDLIILTHPEKDHLAGLIEVLKKYRVENILWTGVLRDTSEFQEWQKLIEEEKNKEGAQIKIAKNPQKINLSTSEVNSYIEVLFPLESLEGKEMKDSNNSSIIAKLVFGENSFLFTGDIYKSAEKKLIDGGLDLNSDVLKVSHHGSKTSSGEEFLAAISPEIAVISVGKDNSYGHPHSETLETLAKYDIKVLRTDRDGDIKILCNSQSLKLKLRK